MSTLQSKAFDLAKRQLNPQSKWYRDDLADLRALYAKKKDADCRETIARLSARVSQAEIDRNCQLEGLR